MTPSDIGIAPVAEQAVVVKYALDQLHDVAEGWPQGNAYYRAYAPAVDALDALVSRCEAAEAFVTSYLAGSLTDDQISAALATRGVA